MSEWLDHDEPQAKRVQLDLQTRSLRRLKALKEKTEAASYSEVVRNALQVYEALIEDLEAGNELLIRDRDGKVGPYRIIST